MSKTVFGGIDPGLTGGLAFIIAGSPIPALFPMPTTKKANSKKQMKTVLDARGLRVLLRDMQREYPDLFILVEAAQLRPAQESSGHVCPRCNKEHMFVGAGLASNAKFMGQYHRILGQLEGLGIKYDVIHPRKWKADVFRGHPGDDKDYSRLIASSLFPAIKDKLEMKKSEGIAEALLIADYARRSANPLEAMVALMGPPRR